MSQPFPFDFKATRADPNWQETVFWPVSQERRFAAAKQSYTQYLEFLEQWPNDDERAVLTLAAVGPASIARILIEALLALEAEDAGQGHIISSNPVIDDLRSAEPNAPLPNNDLSASLKPMATPRHTWLRRIARMASWTPLLKLPMALAAPQVTAINHNPMLISEAAKSGLRIEYRHAESFLAMARSHKAAPAISDVRRAEIAEALLDSLMAIDGIQVRRRERAKSHLRPQLLGLMKQADVDMQGFRYVKQIPENLWAGTGGYYPSRAAGLEVCRRGGTVTRFEHGFGTGLIAEHAALITCDLSVCDRYVSYTPQSADSLRNDPALNIIPSSRRPEIFGGNGDPHVSIKHKSTKKIGRLKVLYGSTILTGFRQFYPPVIPDPIYLDWQFRLVKMLQTLPIDLIFRPHPEGLLRGQRHPVADLVTPSPVPYEQSIDEADILLFDRADSTTMSTAMCSDLPIVLIGWDNPPFNDLGQRLLTERCKIIRATFDDRNRPTINPQELEESLLAPVGHFDPEPFRQFLLQAKQDEY